MATVGCILLQRVRRAANALFSKPLQLRLSRLVHTLCGCQNHLILWLQAMGIFAMTMDLHGMIGSIPARRDDSRPQHQDSRFSQVWRQSRKIAATNKTPAELSCLFSDNRAFEPLPYRFGSGIRDPVPFAIEGIDEPVRQTYAQSDGNSSP